MAGKGRWGSKLKICPTCKNKSDKKVVVTNEGKNRKEKKCATCLGIGRVPRNPPKR